jgi:DNA anti-recombination protein RmuC
MEDEVKELSKYAKETGKQNIKRLDEGMKNLYAKLTPQQKKEYDEELRKRMEKLKKAK